MSLFEFIIGMISVLIALAVVQLLVGVGRLVQARGTVTPYLPHTLWNCNIFMVLFLHWWSLWDFRDIEWNWAMFFLCLLGPTAAFFAATLLCPVPDGDEPVDLREHYDRIRQLFLGVVAATYALITIDGPLFGTEEAFNGLRLVQITLIGSVLVAYVSPRPRLQTIAAGVTFTACVGAMTVRFLPGAYG